NNFTQLLNKSVALAGNRKERVFVVSIPDYSVTPFVSQSNKAQVSKEVDWFNAINKQATLSYGIVYIDITTGSREGATNAALIANDGLHPSGLEYKKWADALFVKMREVLK
ncbi:MAG: SGNH/GDSL hydrolase family protein, partial [Chitinophagaceae bacterium]|nr:SGNH/GDSL hydrolase family protein [Chitinophagaceae bacterium]